MTIKRVAIWAAVSSAAQASTDKDSLPSQKRDGQAWADAIGGVVVAVYEVPGHSRNLIFYQDAEREMEAYAALRQDCQAKAFDVLWCRARDRLGRTDALIAQVEALVTSAGAEVYSAAMPHAIGQASTTSALFMSAIESASAQAENIERQRRHKSGMIARTRRGLPSRWPYGYKPIRDSNGKIIGGEFDDNAGALQIIGEMYADGRSYFDICNVLNASPYKPASGGRWPRWTIHNIVSNSFYVGQCHWGEFIGDTSSLYPPAWTPELWERIQAEMARRSPGGSPPASRFTGIAVCARCGQKMSSYRMHGKYRGFRCRTHINAAFTGITCHFNGTREQDIAEAVEAALIELADPDVLRARLAGGSNERQNLQDRLNKANSDAAAIQAKRERLALLVADEKMLPDVYRSSDDKLVGELIEAKRQASELGAMLAAMPSQEAKRARIETMIGLVQSEPGWIIQADMQTVRQALIEAGIKVLAENSLVVTVVIE